MNTRPAGKTIGRFEVARVLFPIVVNQNPVGLFYADLRRGPLEISREEANLLVTLRNQPVLAFRQVSAR